MAQNNNRSGNEERDQYFEDRAGTDKAHFHVVPHEQEGWAVKKEGEDEPTHTTGSKSEAVKKPTAWRKKPAPWPSSITNTDESKNSITMKIRKSGGFSEIHRFF